MKKNNIYNLRKAKGISQEELANVLDVTRQTISNWELGESSPNAEQLLEMSKYFNVNLDEILGVKELNDKSIKINRINILLFVLVLVFASGLIISIILLFNEKDKHVFKLDETTKTRLKETTSLSIGKSFIRTYDVKNIKKVKYDGETYGCYESSFEIRLKNNSGEDVTLQLSSVDDLLYNLESNKSYEFTFQLVGEQKLEEDTIQTIFAYCKILSINETNKVGKNQINQQIQ